MPDAPRATSPRPPADACDDGLLSREQLLRILNVSNSQFNGEYRKQISEANVVRGRRGVLRFKPEAVHELMMYYLARQRQRDRDAGTKGTPGTQGAHTPADDRGRAPNHLDEKRKWEAHRARTDYLREIGQLVEVDVVLESLRPYMNVLRDFGDTMRSQFGNDGVEAHNRMIREAERRMQEAIDKRLAERNGDWLPHEEGVRGVGG